MRDRRANFLIIPLIVSLLALGNFFTIFIERIEDPSDPFTDFYFKLSFEKNILFFPQSLFYYMSSIEDHELLLSLWKEKRNPICQPSLQKKLMAFTNLVGLSVPTIILSISLNIPPFLPPRLVISSLSSNTCSIIRKIPSPENIS